MRPSNRLFEVLIPKRPVSHQARNRDNLQAWKNYVYGRARSAWTRGVPLSGVPLRFTLVYLCDGSPADTDNIVKPIQDALVGVVFSDDSWVSDVDSHRRFLSDGVDITNLPSLLIEGVLSGEECVYVAVTQAEPLEMYL